MQDGHVESYQPLLPSPNTDNTPVPIEPPATPEADDDSDYEANPLEHCQDQYFEPDERQYLSNTEPDVRF